MPRENVPLFAFNRGIISPLGLARTDLKRTALSAEMQTNWVPRVLGSMMLRAGFGYIHGIYGNKKSYTLDFIYSRDQTAQLEITDQAMRIIIDDEVVSRGSVATAVTNGTFAGSLTGWTDADEAGASSVWVSGNSMGLTGTRYNAAIRQQKVTVGLSDQNKEHALRIVIARGEITFSVGATAGSDEYIAETTLGIGTHSLAFTPAADFWINILARTEYQTLVTSVAIEAAGEVIIPAPWLESDLSLLRHHQSADIVYVACAGYLQRKIERRAAGRSWSIVNYEPEDGPFMVDNVTSTRLTPSGLSGDITITSDRSYFKSTNVGSLFRITSVGQKTQISAGGEGQFTDPIRVSGVTANRQFTLDISGTWVGTITLQRSVGDTSSWVDVSTYSSNTTTTFNDGFDNQIIYYRLGFNTGDYTSGTAMLALTYANGGLTGIARVTAFNSVTSVDAIVLTPFGGTDSSEIWAEGMWSDRRGWPSAVRLSEGRLWWAGKSKYAGSVSDAYESYDDTVTGDSAPLIKSVGSGPVDNINFILDLNRLILGSDSAEWQVKSSTLDEPLTASNSSSKAASTQGSAAVAAVKLDDRGLFVQAGGIKLYQLDDKTDPNSNYLSVDLNELTPELCAAGIVRIAVQRQPDTRIHCVLADGTVALLVSQPAENVLCWVLLETDGVIEDVVVLPGTIEDLVYYTVARTVNGSTVRYRERWALESECRGGTLNKQADSFIVYSGSPTTTITGLDHLEGCEVVCWADGKDMGGLSRNKFTVSSGQITLPSAVSNAVVGLYYEAPFKSAKLAYAAAGGTALTVKKKVDHLGVIARNMHYQGLRYGKNFDVDGNGNYPNLQDLPRVVDGATTPADTVWTDYDVLPSEFKGDWDTDSRLCLLAQAPRPCTLLAAPIRINTNG